MKRFQLVLTSQEGDSAPVVVRAVNLRFSGEDIPGEEFCMVKRAMELYRDALNHMGKWTPENRAKLRNFWTGRPR
jgi:hypothetical protein